MYNEIFEVTRADYANMISEIKFDARELKENKFDEDNHAFEIYSNKTNKLLCARLSHPVSERPEQYYIINLPDDDERLAPVPRISVVLETKEEVQTFLNKLSEMRKN